MKRTRVLSLVLVVSLIFCITSCSKLKFEAISGAKFNNALSKADDEYAQLIEECEEGIIFTTSEDSTYYNTSDKKQIADIVGDTTCKEVKMLMSEPYEDTTLTYMYLKFDEKQDAREFFVDTWYDSVEGDEKNYDGTLELDMNETLGYIYYDCKSDDITIAEGDIFGGIYLADDTVVVVTGTNCDKASRKNIMAIIAKLEYPFVEK